MFSLTVFGEVIEHPKSSDSVIGDEITLTCKISSTKCCARWKHNPTGDKDTLHSITSNLEVTVRYKDRYSLIADIETGYYNLTLRNIRRDDAGKYLCSDGDIKDDKFFAELVVLGENVQHVHDCMTDWANVYSSLSIVSYHSKYMWKKIQITADY